MKCLKRIIKKEITKLIPWQRKCLDGSKMELVCPALLSAHEQPCHNSQIIDARQPCCFSLRFPPSLIEQLHYHEIASPKNNRI